MVRLPFRCTLAGCGVSREKNMEAELIEQGLELMVAGMGTVFVFLTCLVIATTGMSALVARFLPEETVFVGVTADEVAAISAAIAEHRRRH